ncbi:phage terminase small subunit [Klebsiella michiganensis]|uniref:phage terminase small subunit n=1 Tax=Klebsiella TaxID=570 RepID=UPI00244334C8|nr:MULTISPECIES: phage terminase small subunit [Klebsiella]MDQ7855514.1 phage terminase small subunit [Klebsiella michiganensis]
MALNLVAFRRQLLDQAKQRQSPRTRPAAQTADTDSLHLQLLSLERDRERLAALPRIQDRVALKRDELLPKWVPVVERYLAGSEIYSYPVLGWCVIWLFDAGDIEKALDWADIAIAQDQPTPDRIKSRFPAFVADQVLAWAEQQAEAGNSIEPYFSRVFQQVREVWRLHEKHTAKWYKFAGEFLLRDTNGTPAPSIITDSDRLVRALELLLIADGLWPKIGVKSRINRINARLRQLEKAGADAQ